MRRILTKVLFITLSVSLFAQSNLIDGVVWIVGDDAILKSEIEENRLRAQYEGTRFNGDPNCIIPEQIAIQKLFIHQAKLDSIEANAGSVETQVNMRISHFLRQIGSKEKMEEYFGKSFNDIKDEMRKMITDQMLVQQMQGKLTEEIKTTPAEVRKYYNSLPSDSIPMIPAMVEVQILTLEPPIPATDIESLKTRLREFTERVNSGTDFSLLARLYSDDVESAKNGGELGFMGRGELVPEFANAAFAITEPGKVSRVVETEFGFHIIQLIEKRGDRVNCRHILLRPKASAEAQQLAISRLDSIVTIVRPNKLSFEAAVAYYSSDKDTRMNNGLMMNQSNGSSKFEYQDLPQEISKAVYSLNAGEISEPFKMMNLQLGREVFAIVKVKSKTDSHKANLSDDYQELTKYYEAFKKAELLENWIQKKMSEVYIYIEPEWQNCDFKYKNWIKE